MTATFSTGDLLCGRFRVGRFIARGGMGELYEAHDLELNERVALKTIRPDIAGNDQVNQRFRREVQLARKVTHSGICRIFDLFQHQPQGEPAVAFITMELLEGETLAERLRREGPYSADEALPIVRQLASALAAAHAAGVVHRDLKASNIMLLPSAAGTAPRAVITDFGIAHRVMADTAAATGPTAEWLGTPDYMAPEQIDGAPITTATDIYSLGIVIYEMVTGVRPFAEDTPFATAMRRVSGAPPRPPREIAPDLPPAWDAVIMRCLARYPERRFPDGASVLAALGDGGPAPPGAGRHSRLVAGVAVVAALAFGAAVWNDLLTADPTGEPATAAGDAAVARPAVAVLGFRNLAGRADVQWLSTAFAEMLMTELGAGGSLRTIPGENVSRMRAELDLEDAESYGTTTLSRIRRNLGSDLIVYGSYATVGEGASATIRFDIRVAQRAGEEQTVVSETGRADELFDLVARAGRRLRQHLDLDVASAVADAARAAQPGSAETARLYADGVDRLRRFDALGARAVLEDAIRSEPDFPLAHAALGTAWAALGYDAKAVAAAQRAFELSSRLPRADRLSVEGTYRELASSWPDAIKIWETLATFYPDDVEYALKLAGAQIASGTPADGIAAVERFRRQFPDVVDARLELMESSAAETLSDFRRARAAADRAIAVADSQGARLLAAAGKLAAGTAALRQGDGDAAIALFTDARAAYAQAGNRAGVARALNNLASAVGERGDTRKTVALYQEGLAIAQEIGDQDLTARLLNNLAIQHRRAGDLQASLRLNEQSLAIRREINDRTSAAVSLNNIGNVLLDLGQLKEASRHYEESAAMSREIGDRRGLARALHNAAESLKLQGELSRARTTNDEALAIRRTIDDPASLATSLYGQGQTLALQGDLDGATRLLNEALAIDRKLDRRRPIGYTMYALGDIALVSGDLAAARRHHQEALDLRTALGEKGTAAESRIALAIVALEEGRQDTAEALARAAVPVFAAQGAAENEAMARAVLARAVLAKRMDEARTEIDRAEQRVRQSENLLARMPVTIAAAIVAAAGGNAAQAERSLDAVAADAARRGIARLEFEARRALASIGRGGIPGQPRGAAYLNALRRDANERGFRLFTRLR